jgi:hypothetical protein
MPSIAHITRVGAIAVVKRFALSDELSPSIGIASVAVQCILYGMSLYLNAWTIMNN